MTKKLPLRCNSFTLIEMLVVMALIGILAGLIATVLLKVRSTSARVSCGEHLGQIGALMNSVMLRNDGVYPPLFQDADGNNVTTWDGDDGIPWWVVIHNEMGGPQLTATGNELDLDDQIPKNMDLFHCRMAPGLVNPDPALTNRENVLALHLSISYGLNFDVKRDDGTAYECVQKTDESYPALSNGPASADDRKPDTYRLAEIKAPAEFILISEAHAANGKGGQIAGVATHEDGATAKSQYPIMGRHHGLANVLFADGHVEAIQAETHSQLINDPTSKISWDETINKNTPFWTLPRD